MHLFWALLLLGVVDVESGFRGRHRSRNPIKSGLAAAQLRAATDQGSLAKAYSSGVNSYSAILSHLTQSPAIAKYVALSSPGEEGLVILKDWAADLGRKVSAMHKHFLAAEAAAANQIKAQNALIQNLAVQSSQLDGSILTQDKQVASLVTAVNGKNNEVKLAAKSLSDTEAGLRSAEAAVKSAEDKLSKVKNKCITGRRKRDVSDILLRRSKRGWLKKIGRAIAKPFEKVGHAVERGICRGVGGLTGRIKNVKRTRDGAKRNRDAARTRLNQKRSQLASIQKQLASKRNGLKSARSRRAVLAKERTKLLASITTTSKLGEDMKKAAVFVGSLLVRGKVLKEAMDELMLLNVEVLATPLQEVGSMLNGVGTLPPLPRLLPAQQNTIRANLAVFTKALPNYPLIMA